MKIFLKIVLVFVIASAAQQSHAQTNVYHPFPDSAFWRVDVYYYKINMGPCWANYYFHYYISGDTLINSYVHKKIYRSSVAHTNPPCQFWLDSGYVGALRDDSLANKTFFIAPNQNGDSLLYDYNLKAGDTLKGIIAFCTTKVITSVDSILLNGQYRKRWNYIDCENINQFIIEGVGTSAGLIEIFSSGGLLIHNHLVCVKDSTSTLFTSNYNSNFGCNLVFADVNEIKPNNDLQISLNPSSGIFNLASSKIFFSVEIFDIFGNVVMRKEANGSQLEIDITTQPKGIYFVKAIDEEGNFGVKKIVLE